MNNMQDTQHTDIKCFLVVLCYIYTIFKNVWKKKMLHNWKASLWTHFLGKIIKL